MEVNIDDLRSIIYGEGHTGWLTAEAMQAGILQGQDGDQEALVNPLAWKAWLHGGQQEEKLPDIITFPPRNIAIPMHWRNHWTLRYLDVVNEIVYHRDLIFNPQCHQKAQNRLYLHTYDTRGYGRGSMTF